MRRSPVSLLKLRYSSARRGKTPSCPQASGSGPGYERSQLTWAVRALVPTKHTAGFGNYIASHHTIGVHNRMRCALPTRQSVGTDVEILQVGQVPGLWQAPCR